MNSILIIGGGSMGQRHLRNARALGEKDISLVETNLERAKKLQKELMVPIFSSVAAAFKQKKYNIAIICSPPVFHLEHLLLCAQHGCDIFVEKPLAHTMVGLKKIVDLIKRKKLVTMVGSNWKFHPSFQKIKTIIDAGTVGKILSARCQTGKYLPDWHPKEDYRRGYSANKKMGGGVLLDYHEMDYLTWFLGDVAKVACIAKKVSTLEMEVEDAAEIIVQFKSGSIGEIHIDYLQRFAQRNYEFFGETGTIKWDLNLKKVILQTVRKGTQEFPEVPNYELNQMYVEELKHFLKNVKKRSSTITPIENTKVLELVMAATESAKKNKFVSLYQSI